MFVWVFLAGFFLTLIRLLLSLLVLAISLHMHLSKTRLFIFTFFKRKSEFFIDTYCREAKNLMQTVHYNHNSSHLLKALLFTEVMPIHPSSVMIKL